MKTKSWIPLESNPDVLNTYARTLGLDLSDHAFCDVLGLDKDLLCMVPQPVLAILMCFPITKETEAASKAEDVASGSTTATEVDYFMKQTIGNACGTIGLLHIVGNCTQQLKLTKDSFLDQFFKATKDLDPAARGKYLEDPPEGALSIEEAHQAAASEGNTAPPSEDEDVNLHFVVFVQRKGRLLQLDGRRPRPIDCGATTESTLLQDTAGVVKKFAELTHSISFNLIALAAIEA
ncbi:hypothetical protein CEUSTIGMA_g9162.t1 [Chlamydomonas eustigma]|uniref:Ubiquitin carboxyl-terminal hydrolase n=1 Tax=Chlamydomonas eustigma TaxID=1157962 RepID=A0A250XF70_9CHLO|nr:hypothetical protein CEUSTIGMA_g9162.t1 [Chlamydomonas eustigma]|eukprot:GAX81734.1 hypothetical protein CEUSTIGMA_g9162.t1 [Chlamydomonas eustigma]